MKDIILVGGGGHCISVLDSLKGNNEFRVKGVFDMPDKLGTEIGGFKVIGSDKDFERFYSEGVEYAFIALGSIKSSAIREKIYMKLKSVGYRLPAIIDRTSIISEGIEIGEGAFIGKRAIVNVGAKIGKNCIINSGAIIEHDCRIGDFVHVAPGTTLSGGVTVGEGSLLGANSTVIQYINIGHHTVIGAGSVVIRNIGSGRVAVGNPCKEVKYL